MASPDLVGPAEYTWGVDKVLMMKQEASRIGNRLNLLFIFQPPDRFGAGNLLMSIFQLDAILGPEDSTRPCGVAERPVVPVSYRTDYQENIRRKMTDLLRCHNPVAASIITVRLDRTDQIILDSNHVGYCFL